MSRFTPRDHGVGCVSLNLMFDFVTFDHVTISQLNPAGVMVIFHQGYFGDFVAD